MTKNIKFLDEAIQNLITISNYIDAKNRTIKTDFTDKGQEFLSNAIECFKYAKNELIEQEKKSKEEEDI